MYKFVKPFTAFKNAGNPNISSLDKWKIALRDPAYLIILLIAIAGNIYSLFFYNNL